MTNNHALLLQAIKTNNLEEARSLLEQNVNPNGNHHEPLFEALNAKHFEVAKMLLSYGADINGQMTTWKQTPLTYFAENGDAKTVAWLLNNGADIESTNTFGWTALGSAARNADREIVDLLVDRGASFEHLDKRGNSPIDLARDLNHEEFAKYLKILKEQRRLLDNINDAPDLVSGIRF